jgi:hypothetical protein
MMALTLTQPWATLVANGAKRFETRSWRTTYRGILAIHAAKGMPSEAKQLCVATRFFRALEERAVNDLPRGSVIAIAELIDIVPVERIRGSLSPDELAFGDFGLGRWAWELWPVNPLAEPVPAIGHLGLWEWDPPDSLRPLLFGRPRTLA